jgi:hypothetical protein
MNIFEDLAYFNISNLLFGVILIVILHFIWSSRTQRKLGAIGAIIFVAVYYFCFTYVENKFYSKIK